MLRHLVSFHVLYIVDSAAVNMCVVHVSFWIMVFSGHMPSSGIVGHMVLLFLVNWWLSSKNLPAMQEMGVQSWIRKIPWRRKWQPTPDSCLENSVDREVWQATVCGITKSWTRLGTHSLTYLRSLQAVLHSGVSIYIPTKSAKEFSFLHILSSIYCL